MKQAASAHARTSALAFAFAVASAFGGAPTALAQDVGISAGRPMPGRAIAVETSGRELTLCEPECELRVPRGAPLRIGMRAGDRPIEWTSTIEPTVDLRLDLVLRDRSTERTVAAVMLGLTAALVVATGVVGIATEPTPPNLGWFGDHHGLVFAGIAAGVVLVFGVPSAVTALVFERDDPAIDAIPVE